MYKEPEWIREIAGWISYTHTSKGEIVADTVQLYQSSLGSPYLQISRKGEFVWKQEAYWFEWQERRLSNKVHDLRIKWWPEKDELKIPGLGHFKRSADGQLSTINTEAADSVRLLLHPSLEAMLDSTLVLGFDWRHLQQIHFGDSLVQYNIKPNLRNVIVDYEHEDMAYFFIEKGLWIDWQPVVKRGTIHVGWDYDIWFHWNGKELVPTKPGQTAEFTFARDTVDWKGLTNATWEEGGQNHGTTMTYVRDEIAGGKKIHVFTTDSGTAGITFNPVTQEGVLTITGEQPMRFTLYAGGLVESPTYLSFAWK